MPRLRIASPAGARRHPGSMRPALAAVQARLGQPAAAWRALEEGLGRGLLDELTARQDQRLTPAERARLRELTGELNGSTGWPRPRSRTSTRLCRRSDRRPEAPARAGQHRPG